MSRRMQHEEFRERSVGENLADTAAVRTGSASDGLPVGADLLDDPVKQYMRSIGQIPLLTAAEEHELAQAIAVGVRAREQFGYASPQQQQLLQQLIACGEEARRQMIQANLRLVVSIANTLARRSGMNLMDLIQEGNLGLMRAVETFDAEKGFRFSTYATWWIRQAISRAIGNHARLVRIPVHLHETLLSIRRVSARMQQTLQREPSAEELAEALGIPLVRIQRALNAAQQPLSLDRPVGEEGDANLADFVADGAHDALEERVAYDMAREQIAQVLSRLPERESTVLQLRYGLNDGQPRTLEEVGAVFGITRERVRQIEEKALRKLRSPGLARLLRGYIE